MDGLCSSPALLSEASRLRVVVLVHAALGWWEGPVLQAAAGVVTTSRWSRDVWRPAAAWTGSPVASPASIRRRSRPVALGWRAAQRRCRDGVEGYDVLAAALRLLDDLAWSPPGRGLDREVEPAFAATVPPVVRLSGPMTRAPSSTRPRGGGPARPGVAGRDLRDGRDRGARPGVPVVASDVGGVREALGDGGVSSRRATPSRCRPPCARG